MSAVCSCEVCNDCKLSVVINVCSFCEVSVASSSAISCDSGLGECCLGESGLGESGLGEFGLGESRALEKGQIVILFLLTSERRA